MALFKPMYGSSTNLATQALHDGYAYFTTDDGHFYIDYKDLLDNQIKRKPISGILQVTVTQISGSTITVSHSVEEIISAAQAGFDVQCFLPIQTTNDQDLVYKTFRLYEYTEDRAFFIGLGRDIRVDDQKLLPLTLGVQLVTIVGNTVEYVSNFDHSITDITAKTNVGSLQWRVTGTDTYNELEIYAKQLATSTNIGDVNAPVYFKNGVPTVCDVDLSPITGDMIREITGHYNIYLESEVQV